MSLLQTHATVHDFDHIPIMQVNDNDNFGRDVSHLFSSDFTNARSTDISCRRALAMDIRAACMSAGFFYLKNHGISPEIIMSAYHALQHFFDLPLEEKMKLDMTGTSSLRGYNPLFSAQNDAESKLKDAHEGFEFGYEDLEALDLSRGSSAHLGKANVWPDSATSPGFREAMLTYYHAAVQLGKLLFPLLALALDIEEDFFADKTRTAAALLRGLHYPPQPRRTEDVETAQAMGIGAHTDWEVFTILWQQPGIQALEVQNEIGQWLPAPPIEGTLVINLGDMLARWTNDVFRSTVHRASNASGEERYSIPLFFGTDYDVRLEPIPSCVSEAHPSKYEVVTAGEYVRKRAQATYGH